MKCTQNSTINFKILLLLDAIKTEKLIMYGLWIRISYDVIVKMHHGTRTCCNGMQNYKIFPNKHILFLFNLHMTVDKIFEFFFFKTAARVYRKINKIKQKKKIEQMCCVMKKRILYFQFFFSFVFVFIFSMKPLKFLIVIQCVVAILLLYAVLI